MGPLGPAIVGICGFPYKCPPAPSECALMLHHYLTERGARRDYLVPRSAHRITRHDDGESLGQVEISAAYGRQAEVVERFTLWTEAGVSFTYSEGRFDGRLAETVQNGQSPFAALWESGRTILAGVLFIFPGVISDAIALVLLVWPSSTTPVNRRRQEDDNVIEGEVKVVETGCIEIKSDRH